MTTETDEINTMNKIFTKVGFSDWIDHTPGDCPVHPETIVIVELGGDPNDLLEPLRAKDIDWGDMGDNVTKYRFRRNPK
jgi:hypothetical protein